MNYISIFVLGALVLSCSPTTKQTSARSNSEETVQDSGDTATVVGTVEQEDTDLFVNEINVDDWSTFEAQNTAA